MGRKVLLLVDESPNSEHAVKFFASSCSRKDDEVTLMHVVTGPRTDIHGAVAAYKTAKDSGVFLKLTSFLVENDVPETQIKSKSTVATSGVSTHSVCGAIKDYVETHPTDLIVMGSRGMSAIKQFITGLGGVSDYVVKHIPVAALVVHYPQMIKEVPENVVA
mmetsp:Transcript_9429/g.19880  ORF Transcript_9429/g.19880 Transcript_9429/m.19880 type:complete len:162 (-) Transcript_9429:331-816(-)|eukprot:CAMPEP_0185845408 /NCGR_PEP_ID=MMETSP1354-20130828/1398_1 /TAXON_ID=708628 /ORGANISM="Erythrolobus madagascarensis, Strain CCMP3276" /LENGTH=161 /DNA_ID=CAMNT_0028545371 /DNA_START=189 /DNA_END=674 /DNA_ORIENTATION=-